MKYWRGYLTAAIFAAISWMLMQTAEKYSTLVDMVYPYVTRSVQGFLVEWTAGFDFCVWQIAILVFCVLALAILVLIFVFKGSIIQWFGWVLAAVSVVFCLHTGLYGLNHYAGPIEDDLRLTMVDYTQDELEDALIYYRDMANDLAVSMHRDYQGMVDYPAFASLARMAPNGFRTLVLERSFSVFAGDYTPVKELGWPELYTAAGISGYTCYVTGEAAVNSQIPAVSQPFIICREMAHRMCIAREEDASFAAFLACEASSSEEYRYSAYFMAYRYCYDALYAIDPAAAMRIRSGCVIELLLDLEYYNTFFSSREDAEIIELTDTVTSVNLAIRGDEDGIISNGSVCDYLVNWYLTEYNTEEEAPEFLFDPYDETQVDLSGIVNAVIPQP